jgi:8-oxo-dGTP pyrophosphatase MutT (NUDIX family)
MTGPRLRTDVIDVYVLRRAPHAQLLQLRRARAPFVAAWHPVMGHIEPGETAVNAARRELAEEIALGPTGILGLYQLEQTYPFFIADRDEIHLSPRFVAEVAPGFSPTLNHEHDAHRWIDLADAQRLLLWPGQRHAAREIETAILPGGDTAAALRLPPPDQQA